MKADAKVGFRAGSPAARLEMSALSLLVYSVGALTQQSTYPKSLGNCAWHCSGRLKPKTNMKE